MKYAIKMYHIVQFTAELEEVVVEATSIEVHEGGVITFHDEGGNQVFVLATTDATVRLIGDDE